MITRDKIKQAAKDYIDTFDWQLKSTAFIRIHSFTAGAKWAIKEMNKTEWKVPNAEDFKELEEFAENNALIWDEKDTKNIEPKNKKNENQEMEN